MPIPFNSILSSPVANSTFLDKTQDDTMGGVLTLNDGNTNQISNAQLELNKRKLFIDSSSYISLEQITLDSVSENQIFKVVGNLAPVTLNSLVFSNQPADGSRITLIGQDDTNTVTINLNDVQFGQYINGNATLLRGYILELIYDATAERFFELRRNF